MPDLADKAIEYVRQQKIAHARQALLRVLRTGRDPCPAPRAEGLDRQVRGQVRPRLGQAARGDLRPAEGARRHRRRLRADRPRPRACRPGTTCADEQKPVLARQMEVYAAFLEYADHHTGRVIDALEELDILEDTLIYYIIGDNGASAEGGINGAYMLTTASNGGASSRPSTSGRSTSTRSAAPTRTTTTRSPGRTRCARRTSGPSRSPRTTAAPATARSCTGRAASRPRARCASSGTTSSTSRRPCSTWPASPSRTR